MSAGLNRATLLGNIGREPELKSTKTSAFLALSLATTTSYLDADRARVEKTEWHNVTVWGARAEALAKLLKKGDRLYVEGEIQTRSYEKDGVRHWATSINASNVVLCGRSNSSDSSDSSDDRSNRNSRSNSKKVQNDDEIPF